MPGPIRSVQINPYVRIVGCHHLDQRPRFRGIKLHVIPIEIESLSVRTLTHPAKRAVLSRPVPKINTLVTVGIVNWRDQEYEIVSL